MGVEAVIATQVIDTTTVGRSVMTAVDAAAVLSAIGAQASLVSGTNIKTINSTSLLGSGDITVSASPAGSSGQVQYNNAGAFGGMTAVVYAGSGTLVTVTSQAAADVPLKVKGAAAQSGNLTEWRNSSDTLLLSVSTSGYIIIASAGFIGTATLGWKYVTGSYVSLNNNGSIAYVSIHSGGSYAGSVVAPTDFASACLGWGAINFSTGHIPSAEFGFFRQASNHARLKTLAGTNGRLTLANLDLTGLATSDPVSAGVVWNDSGTLKVSAG